MRQTKRFAVVGSDARQAAAGRALARAGYTVGGVQQLPQADCILLPLPLEQADLPLTQLLGMAKPGALALGGKVTDSARTIARAAGVELVDYFARPELTAVSYTHLFYKLPKAGTEFTSAELIAHWKSLVEKYPIISIEDGLDEGGKSPRLPWRKYPLVPP